MISTNQILCITYVLIKCCEVISQGYIGIYRVFPAQGCLEAEECEEFSRKPLMVPGSTWAGGGQSTLNLERICKDFGSIGTMWKGFPKSLQILFKLR